MCIVVNVRFSLSKILIFSHKKTCLSCSDCKILFGCFCDYLQQLPSEVYIMSNLLCRMFTSFCVASLPPFLLSLVLCQRVKPEDLPQIAGGAWGTPRLQT